MAVILIDNGSAPNDGTGQTLRDAFTRINDNYNAIQLMIDDKITVGETFFISDINGLQDALDELSLEITSLNDAISGLPQDEIDIANLQSQVIALNGNITSLQTQIGQQNGDIQSINVVLDEILDQLGQIEGGEVEEAPIDGRQYARQNASWTVVSGGTGVSGNYVPLSGTTAPITGNLELSDSNRIYIQDGSIQIGGETYGLVFTSDSPSNGLIVNMGANSKGISGELDYTGNITNLDYVQKKYVDTKINTEFPIGANGAIPVWNNGILTNYPNDFSYDSINKRFNLGMQEALSPTANSNYKFKLGTTPDTFATDFFATLLVSDTRTTASNFNGIDSEARGTLSANTTNRIRGGKFVSLVNMNGFNSTNSGGGGEGIEGVTRVTGVGSIDVITGAYFRTLSDINDVTSIVKNAHGIIVPEHSGALLSPFQIATGIVLAEQGLTTRSTNTANIVLGSPSANVGNLTGLFTGKFNIWSPSTFKSYFKGAIGIDNLNPTEKLDVVGNGKFTGTVEVATPSLSGHATTKAYVDTAISMATVKQFTISGGTTLMTNDYNNSIIKIKANSIIAIPAGLMTNWNAIFDVWSGTASFTQGSGVTFSAPDGLSLQENSMCTVYKDGSTNTYRIKGELII